MATIYLVGGPPGAGKKTLLEASRKVLLEGGIVNGSCTFGVGVEPAAQSNVVFMKRDVTSELEKCGELDVPKSESEFDMTLAAGGYALSWVDGDVKYGIPKSALEQHLAAKQRCVLNVSPKVVDKCIKRYESKDVEVYVLYVTASAEELISRLVSRGVKRACGQPVHYAEIVEMVEAAKELEPSGPNVVRIKNEASREEGTALFVDALRGELTYSLMLAPATDSSFQQAIAGVTKELAAEYGMKPFPPYIAVCPSFKATHRHASERAAQVASAIGLSVPCNISGELSIDAEKPFKALALELEASEAIAAATLVARQLLFEDSEPLCHVAYAPHCSLLYSANNEELRTKAGLEKAKGKALALLAAETDLDHFGASRLILTMTTGSAYWCWDEVRSFELAERSSFRDSCQCSLQ